MSKSYRDKKAHKARNFRKYFDEDLQNPADILFKEGIYPNKNFPDIAWSIQGKRRRNSTRRSNQKVKQMVNQLDRAKLKEELIKELNY